MRLDLVLRAGVRDRHVRTARRRGDLLDHPDVEQCAAGDPNELRRVEAVFEILQSVRDRVALVLSSGEVQELAVGDARDDLLERQAPDRCRPVCERGCVATLSVATMRRTRSPRPEFGRGRPAADRRALEPFDRAVHRVSQTDRVDRLEEDNQPRSSRRRGPRTRRTPSRTRRAAAAPCESGGRRPIHSTSGI